MPGPGRLRTDFPDMNQLPTKTKLAFGFGSLAFGIKDQGFNALLMLYYNQVVGLPASQVGLAILIATLIDALLDPIIGQVSDHHRSSWGRRHPFMYGAALPMAIAYALFWAPPEASQSTQMVWLVVTSVIVRLSISLYEIPSAALMAELTSDYDERTTLATYRSLFMAIGLVGMGIVVFQFFLAPTAEQPVGQLNAEGYVQYGYVAAAIMLFSVLVAARGTHDRIPSLIASTPAHHQQGLVTGLKHLLTDRAYVSVVLCVFFFSIAGGVSTALGTYINTYFWKLQSQQLAAIAGGYGLGVIVGLVVAGFSRHLGKKAVTIGAYALALVAFVLLISLRLLGIIDLGPQQMLPWLILQGVLIGATVLVALIMGSSMLADVADHIEAKTGQRMEGLMFAALIMIQKGVSGMGVFLSGVILTVVGFPDKADPATISVDIVERLGLVYVLGIGVMVILALLSIGFYPISRALHQRNQATLQARRAAAA